MAYLGLMIIWCVVLSAINAEHFNEHEKTTMLWAHNLIRASPENPSASNMLEVRWDDFLAEKAKKWVETCHIRNDRFINEDPGQFKKLGQNNWVGSVEVFESAPATPAWIWVKHGTDYSFAKRKCIGEVPVDDCNDFTQVVMATTEAIGCAKKKCSDDVSKELYVTCFYGPGGSSFFKNPYIGGVPCSNCPQDYTCKETLCVLPPAPSERELMDELLGYLQRE